jgi:adenine-specific DNA-methyltransferase
MLRVYVGGGSIRMVSNSNNNNNNNNDNNDNRIKVKRLLHEIFQFNAQDLDFGIYRILNLKRKEIERFIEKDLIDAVEREFKECSKANTEELKKEVKKLYEEIKRDFGSDTFDSEGKAVKYRDTPKVREYEQKREELNNASISKMQMNEVFNHIYEFFSRYYEDGDFISKRRYGGRDKYYIPYNGEEVTLLWATKDQYYVKTTEYFRNYSFNIHDYKVNLLLKSAEMEINDNKSEEDKYFVLCNQDVVNIDKENRVINIYFEWRRLTEDEKRRFDSTQKKNIQSMLVTDAINRIYSEIKDDNIKNMFSQNVSNGKEERTLLEKHLNNYVKRNTTDYFIHKNLKKFLETELEFYIKNEVLDVDELENMDERSIRITKAKVKAIRNICNKIIDFLAQIEDFQKMLFEKKKFVIMTEYVITLDKIKEYAGEEFLESIVDEILKNKEQLNEWKELLEVQVNSKNDLIESTRLDGRRWKKLPLDTRYFGINFKIKLLDAISKRKNLDEILDGILINSENYQALNLLLNKFKGKVQTIYIDPPFNTGSNEFLYKNNYLDSSWMSMMYDRLRLGREFLRSEGSIFVRIDYHGNHYVRMLMDEIFGRENFRNEIIVSRTKTALYIVTPKNASKNLSPSYDNIYWYSKNPNISFPKIAEGVIELKRDAYWKDSKSFYNRPKNRYELYGITPEEGSNWMWEKEEMITAIENYNKFLNEYKIELEKIKKCVEEIRNILGKTIAEQFKEERINNLLEKYWNEKGRKLRFVKKGDNTFYYWVEPIQHVSITDWTSIEGYARSWSFPTENSEILLKRVIELASNEGDLVMDYFLGSGTTTAVAHKLKRKWIGVEMGEYAWTVALRRMKEVLFYDKTGISKEQDVKEKYNENNAGGFFKYHYLEQYEDTLNNITFIEQGTIQETLDAFGDYILRNVFEFETRNSPARLNVEQFKTPFDYKIWVTVKGEKKLVTVDLIETFNYLLGLTVQKYYLFKDRDKGQEREYHCIYGKLGDENILIIWRNMNNIDYKKDKEFIINNIINSNGLKPDRIFINGDSVVEGAESIEPEFKRLMGA